MDALNQALATREPPEGLVHHTDRGSQYASGDYPKVLKAAGAVPSMSRKGNCWDNAVSESFFGTLEQELVRQLDKPWADDEDARREVSAYIHGFFNQTRRHSTSRTRARWTSRRPIGGRKRKPRPRRPRDRHRQDV